MNSELFKKVDGEKIKKYFNDNLNISKSKVCAEAKVNRSAIRDAQIRGKARIVFWDSICDVLKVPRDYFDFVEPTKIEEEPEEEETECSIDLADIQLSLNKIEALLLEQNKLLNTAIAKHIVVKSPTEQWDRIIKKEVRNGRKSNYQL